MVARHLLIKPLDCYALEFGEVHIQNHSIAPENRDARFNGQSWRLGTFRHSEQRCVFSFFYLEVTNS